MTASCFRSALFLALVVGSLALDLKKTTCRVSQNDYVSSDWDNGGKCTMGYSEGLANTGDPTDYNDMTTTTTTTTTGTGTGTMVTVLPWSCRSDSDAGGYMSRVRVTFGKNITAVICSSFDCSPSRDKAFAKEFLKQLAGNKTVTCYTGTVGVYLDVSVSASGQTVSLVDDACSGNGVFDKTTVTCTCSTGWTGSACRDSTVSGAHSNMPLVALTASVVLGVALFA